MIDRLLDGATASRGSPLVLLGEAGLGKSALLEEADSRARRRGMRVASAAGIGSEARLPFAALVDLTHPLEEVLPQLSDGAAKTLAAPSVREPRRPGPATGWACSPGSWSLLLRPALALRC